MYCLVSQRDLIVRLYADDEDAVNHAGYCAQCTGDRYIVLRLWRPRWVDTVSV